MQSYNITLTTFDKTIFFIVFFHFSSLFSISLQKSEKENMFFAISITNIGIVEFVPLIIEIGICDSVNEQIKPPFLQVKLSYKLLFGEYLLV